MYHFIPARGRNKSHHRDDIESKWPFALIFTPKVKLDSQMYPSPGCTSWRPWEKGIWAARRKAPGVPEIWTVNPCREATVLSFSAIKHSPGEHWEARAHWCRGVHGGSSRVYGLLEFACSPHVHQLDWRLGVTGVLGGFLPLGWIPVSQDGWTDIDQLNGFWKVIADLALKHETDAEAKKKMLNWSLGQINPRLDDIYVSGCY